MSDDKILICDECGDIITTGAIYCEDCCLENRAQSYYPIIKMLNEELFMLRHQANINGMNENDDKVIQAYYHIIQEIKKLEKERRF